MLAAARQEGTRAAILQSPHVVSGIDTTDLLGNNGIMLSCHKIETRQQNESEVFAVPNALAVLDCVTITTVHMHQL